ncbi:LOW QUALITY PROTEIN: putative disease resistance RPP13-like protein 1 [Triticum dicoccoides]|uniref:LOW QUALITY PROTEIN: putative disease resistance RPP13-like protein 1 n=1 Tax=Triticum dicoccoides TaxID=85692 RepID=UPI00188FD6BA|nr:LOW QUALITY PROTEIN: putative disease resistance RPP13-like protein 1 [Triticum dicoccoides]
MWIHSRVGILSSQSPDDLRLLMADPVSAAVAVGWAMKAAGWVASPIISELYKKASSLLNFDASQKLKELEPKILLLQRVMEIVEESPYRHRLQQLFNDLKSAFYEAEDILDDVEYYLLEKQIQDDYLKLEVAGPRRNKSHVKKLLTSAMKKCNFLKDQDCGMSKIELKQSLEKIEKVINDACGFFEQMNLPNKSNVNLSKPANSRGAVTTARPPPLVIGRDKDCDNIVAMLHDKEEDAQPDTNRAQCYSVIGIHGISGSGKSTLSQLVCAREQKDGHFNLVMWVHVSQDFSVDAIFRQMSEAASRTPCPQFNNLDTLQTNLEKKLHGKRFLLVLDDVWYNNRDVRQYEKLQQILSPLNAGEAGSKILVTSRTKDALIALGAVEQRCIPMSVLDKDVFLKLFKHYAFHNVCVAADDRIRLEDIVTHIAKKLKGSPLAAKIVGGQLRMRPNIDYWRSSRDGNHLDDTMGALWWSYQHLDEQVRRCFAYCSIFPRRRYLERHELVKLWAAEGFARSSDEGKDLEDVCQGYFDVLVSASFLQPEVGKYSSKMDAYIVHDLLLDLADKVAGSDCFRIENQWKRSGDNWTMEGCEDEVPPDVRHVFVQTYGSELIIEKICKLDNLRTLIIDSAEWKKPVEEKVLKSLFAKLRKLRVLIIASDQGILSVPESIGQLRHLRYLAFMTRYGSDSRLVLPGTLTKLYHMQVLDFGNISDLVFDSCEDMFSLINLRHIIQVPFQEIQSIGRLTLLRTLETFEVRKEQGCELKQLSDLNQLCGKLTILGLQNVESQQEALEANLADKQGLRTLELWWNYDDRAELKEKKVQTEVLEGLCPPKLLESLTIYCYDGLANPSWMMGKYNGGPKYLNTLSLHCCSTKLGPELGGFCSHLRSLYIFGCSWDTLPDQMEHLTSLKDLGLKGCRNIRSLPTLPQSLECFKLSRSNEMLMSSCRTVGDPNWEKLQHVPVAYVDGYRLERRAQYTSSSEPETP